MKKVLALVMALVLVFSLGVSALAAEEAKEHDAPHATKPDTTSEETKRVGGVVGPHGENTDVSTDIYLKIAADDELDPSVDVKVNATGEDGQIYVVDYTDTSKSTFAVTVPLFVCLYAYGNSGGVATPDAASYQIRNQSKYSIKTKINKITEYYPIYTSVVDMLRELVGADALPASITDDQVFVELYNLDGTHGLRKGETVYQTYENIAKVISVSAKNYYYFQNGRVKAIDVVDTNTLADVALKAGATNEAVVRLDGQGSTKFYQTNAWSTDRRPTTADDNMAGATFTLNGVKYERKHIGDPLLPEVNNQPLALVVSEISATTYGWSLVENNPLHAKELFLTINGTNIAGAVDSPLALSGSNWLVTKAASDTQPGTLPLKLNAAIAPSVNEIGESAVVNVAYTLAAEVDADIAA